MAFESEERTAPGRRLETVALCVLFLGIVVLAALQIVLRNFFSYSLYWADEVIRLAVLWLAMIGGITASRESRHIAISIVENYCPPSWRGPAAIAAAAFASVVSAALAWQGYRFVSDSFAFGDTVLNGWPAWIFQAIIPVGFAVMSYRFAAQVLVLVQGGRT